MSFSATHLPAAETGAFSALVQDYLSGSPNLRPLYPWEPNEAGLAEALANRAFPAESRHTLVDALSRQYAGMDIAGTAVESNMLALASGDTFTVCTAHQPNIATGFLYFIYKIIHAIRLAEHLQARHPGRRFVPVYYMGSEDHDLEELGTFFVDNKRYSWDGDGQTGAVGRMKPASVAKLLEKVFEQTGPPGPALDRLRALMVNAYRRRLTVAAATREVAHGLFAKYGLIVIDPDDAALKQQFIPVMRQELLHGGSDQLVANTAATLAEHYKVQAHARDINLFYLADRARERIVREGGHWSTVDGKHSWDESALLAELDAQPGRFSPNVILRPLYQETILPDIAFIGGGAEVAYWLQLRALFERHAVPYPVVLLRQSILILSREAQRIQGLTGMEERQLFQPADAVIKNLLARANPALSLAAEHTGLEALQHTAAGKAAQADATLRAAAEATFKRIHAQLHRLEQKMQRALRRRESTLVDRVHRLRLINYPGGHLQERHENLIPWYALHGSDFIDSIHRFTKPLQGRFLILREQL